MIQSDFDQMLYGYDIYFMLQETVYLKIVVTCSPVMNVVLQQKSVGKLWEPLFGKHMANFLSFKVNLLIVMIHQLCVLYYQ